MRELEHASWKIQDASANDDPHYLEWLNLLIAPGSSIGGARPKAGVRDPDGDLWIAKFPGRADTRDMAAWEMLAHQIVSVTKRDGENDPSPQLLKIADGLRSLADEELDNLQIACPRMMVVSIGVPKQGHCRSACVINVSSMR